MSFTCLVRTLLSITQCWEHRSTGANRKEKPLKRPDKSLGNWPIAMGYRTILLSLSLGLLLISCSLSTQSRKTDEQIVRQIFGYGANVRYDSQGRAVGISCPRTYGLLESFFRHLVGLPDLVCSLKGDTLSPEIGQLTELRFLQLLGTSFTILPPEIGNLAKLESLKIRGGDLVALPPEIGQLGALKKLDLTGNDLTTLPSEIGQLTNLEELELGFNKLEKLPPEIGELDNLRRLYLAHNSLTTIPPEIGKLKSLKEFYLGSNALTTLPPEIGRLTGLEKLEMYRNRLTGLPPEVWQLRGYGTEILTGLRPP